MVSLVQMLIPIYHCTCKGLQGGTLRGPVFFCDFSKGFKKEYSSFEEGNICECVQVCIFLVLLKSIQSGDGTSLLAMSWFTGTILNLNQRFTI